MGARFTETKGRTLFRVGRWNLRMVYTGESYGLNDCLTHSHEEPVVEFFDAEQNLEVFGALGQFVSRYYVETLLESRGAYYMGLNLQGGVPAWSVSVAEMRQVLDWLAVVQPVARSLTP